MNSNAQSFAGYWRNSLADATFTKGGLDTKDIEQFIKCGSEVWQSGSLDNNLVRKLFKDESNDTKTIEIVLRPIVYRKTVEHTFAKSKDIPEFVVPIATNAVLARNGRLYPFKNETIISRDILEPLVQGSFSIGAINSLDTFLTSNVISGINYCEDAEGHCELTEQEFTNAWKTYLTDCDLLLNTVAKDWLSHSDTFQLLNYGYIIKKEIVKSAAMHILPLYDKLRELTNVPTPLFDNFASKHPTAKEKCLASHSLFSKRLSHSGDKFPLAHAQRDALSHLLTMKNGEILAVNGPPGTGKTTMLLSVVASLWSKHALEESEPPVIVAASTNNQAVTNVIDAFGKDFSAGQGVFAGRWLPDINSFGAYYPSQAKAEKSQKKYQTEIFFEKVESKEYFEEAKQHFITCALRAFPELDLEHVTIKDIVKKLHHALKSQEAKLLNIEKSWQELSGIRQRIKKHLGESPTQTKAGYEQHLQTHQSYKNTWQELHQSWQQYLADESIWYALFSWIPTVAKKRRLKANLYLKKIWPAEFDSQQWQTVDAILLFIQDKINQHEQSIQKNTQLIKKADDLLSELKKYLTKWENALSPLEIINNTEWVTLSQADSLADTKIRFPIFLLTTHYWEGRWLIEMEELLPTLEEWKRKTGRKPNEKRWHLRMKLTPCIVSTFYILPTKFKYTGAKYLENYLYNFADLLIVDEAGQVLPEVAGASFSLSKKALVIGDTLQIEPIWSIPAKVDIGNLQNAQIISDTEIEKEYDELKKLGKTAAFGSVMKIAQQASRYHYDADMEPGMFLYEHRRCYDEIIAFCNELVYKDKLIPKRGLPPENSELPTLGYLHIDGICQQSNSGSRLNKLEAKVITQWLIEYKEKLEEKYKEPLHKIVGIITPFGAQVAEIKRVIRTSGCNIDVDGGENSLTVGTVHSLQGAERKIIIFSTVYSKHSNGNFIDNQPSMLNVAVSRAKDSFLVFGDMDILDPSSKTPRGMLANYLFAKQENELNFAYIAREDLTQSENVNWQVLKNAEEHDIFLRDVIEKAQNEIVIVSPWVKLAAIEYINILPLMEMAVQKGIKVYVYTDRELNQSSNNKEKQQAPKNELFKIMMQFKNKGIEAKLVNKVHSKLVIKDTDLLCVGSFNWLSAQREGKYVRHETSLTYSGKSTHLINEIKLLKESLTSRVLPKQNSS